MLSCSSLCQKVRNFSGHKPLLLKTLLKTNMVWEKLRKNPINMPPSLSLPHRLLRPLLSFSMVVTNNLSLFLCCLLQTVTSSLCQYSACRFVYSDQAPDALKPGHANTMINRSYQAQYRGFNTFFSFNWLCSLVAQILTRPIQVALG